MKLIYKKYKLKFIQVWAISHCQGLSYKGIQVVSQVYPRYINTFLFQKKKKKTWIYILEVSNMIPVRYVLDTGTWGKIEYLIHPS